SCDTRQRLFPRCLEFRWRGSKICVANTRKNGIKIRASRFGKKPFLGVRSSRPAQQRLYISL
ncbi:hypothetical protein ON021_07800, partial [Microcoleus sp. HI-ES]|nr:hypothetical protein [Microcoleus sp. HI-ES]